MKEFDFGKTKPRLLIYVPTYNRANLVVGQVSMILPQIEGRDDVRLLVSDNHSPDETFSLLNSLVRESKNASVRRLPSNVGGNANALLGFACDISTDFVWILADDTILSENAIANVLEALNTNPDILSINLLPNEHSRTNFNIRDEGITSVFNSTSWGLFSAVIYNRGFISKSLETGFSYHESSFPHLAIFFDACWQSAEPILVSQLGSMEVFSSFEIDPINDSLYTLSLTGLPLLLDFANRHERKRLSRRLAWSNSVGLAAFRSLHTVGARSSTALLTRNGGAVAWFYLKIGSILARIQRSSIGYFLEKKVSRQAWIQKLARRSKLVLFRLYRENDSSHPKVN